MMKQRQQWTMMFCQQFGCISEAPQHSHSLADTHIVIVEVAEACKGHSWEYIQTCIGQFNRCLPMDIVSYNLPKTPTKKERETCWKEIRAVPNQIWLALLAIIYGDFPWNKCPPNTHISFLSFHIICLNWAMCLHYSEAFAGENDPIPTQQAAAGAHRTVCAD